MFFLYALNKYPNIFQLYYLLMSTTSLLPDTISLIIALNHAWQITIHSDVHCKTNYNMNILNC